MYQHRESQLTVNDTDIDVSQSHHNFEYNGQIFLNGLLYMRTKMENLDVKKNIKAIFFYNK